MKRTKPPQSKLSTQMKRKVSSPQEKKPEYDGDIAQVVSTGSTLLDLAISGGRIHGGGIPTGIMVEIFGPSGSGKTVLLCEIAGAIQRKKGEVMFHDPEARLNKQFARMFDLDTDRMAYSNPNTVPEIFKEVRQWKPKSKSVNGIFADSLAALSTDMEMGKDEGDKMGMRRAKEFSEELRKTCRILANKQLLMVCSNQIRQNIDAGQWGQKYTSPGGEAIGFYSSLRLRTFNAEKIKKAKKVADKDVKRVIGVTTTIEVFKSSVWKPLRTAQVSIIFDYGIDDVRENLKFLKTYTGSDTYKVGGNHIGKTIDGAIAVVEGDNLEKRLKREVIDLWMEIEEKFDSNRKPKKR